MSAFKDYAESYQDIADALGIGKAWGKVYGNKDLGAAQEVNEFLDLELKRLQTKPEITDAEDDLIGDLHSMWEITENLIADDFDNNEGANNAV